MDNQQRFVRPNAFASRAGPRPLVSGRSFHQEVPTNLIQQQEDYSRSYLTQTVVPNTALPSTRYSMVSIPPTARAPMPNTSRAPTNATWIGPNSVRGPIAVPVIPAQPQQYAVPAYVFRPSTTMPRHDQQLEEAKGPYVAAQPSQPPMTSRSLPQPPPATARASQHPVNGKCENVPPTAPPQTSRTHAPNGPVEQHSGSPQTSRQRPEARVPATQPPATARSSPTQPSFTARKVAPQPSVPQTARSANRTADESSNASPGSGAPQSAKASAPKKEAEKKDAAKPKEANRAPSARTKGAAPPPQKKTVAPLPLNNVSKGSSQSARRQEAFVDTTQILRPAGKIKQFVLDILAFIKIEHDFFSIFFADEHAYYGRKRRTLNLVSIILLDFIVSSLVLFTVFMLFGRECSQMRACSRACIKAFDEDLCAPVEVELCSFAEVQSTKLRWFHFPEPFTKRDAWKSCWKQAQHKERHCNASVQASFSLRVEGVTYCQPYCHSNSTPKYDIDGRQQCIEYEVDNTTLSLKRDMLCPVPDTTAACSSVLGRVAQVLLKTAVTVAFVMPISKFIKFMLRYTADPLRREASKTLFLVFAIGCTALTLAMLAFSVICFFLMNIGNLDDFDSRDSVFLAEQWGMWMLIFVLSIVVQLLVVDVLWLSIWHILIVRRSKKKEKQRLADPNEYLRTRSGSGFFVTPRDNDTDSVQANAQQADSEEDGSGGENAPSDGADSEYEEYLRELDLAPAPQQQQQQQQPARSLWL